MSVSVQQAIERGRRIYRGWWIVLSCYFAQMIASGASGWVFGILIAPMGQELGWSRGEIVMAITISTLLGGLLAAPLGPIFDRSGPRVLMTVSLVIAGTALIALWFVQEKWQYYLVWAAFGVASPGFHVGPVVALANWFIRRRALAFMLFTFGSATAGIFLTRIAAVIAAGYGWRSVWVLMGAMVWLLVPLTWASVRRRPEDVGLLPDGDRFATDAAAGDETSAPSIEVQWTAREALRTPAFWLLTFGFTLVAAPSSSIFVHMAPYVVSKGHSLASGAAVVSWYGIGVLGGRPVYGFLIGRIGVHRTLILYAASYGAVILAFLLPTGLPAIEVTAVLLGIAIAGGQQLQAQVMPDYFGRSAVGALSGYSGVALTLSRAGGPLVAAIAFDRAANYVVPFAAFGIACLVAALAFVLAPPPRHPSASP